MTRSGLALALLLASFRAVAGDAALAARYFEDALSRYEKNDDTGAVVQLKNALQQDSRLLQAQLLLGRAQLRQGNPTAAEAAFDSAIKLGADRSEIILLLAQAYLAQGKYRTLIDLSPMAGLSENSRQELAILQAYAHMEAGDGARAETRLNEAAKAGKSAPLLVAQGMLQLRQGRLSQARALADQALAINPREATAWNLRASVDHMQGAAQNALDAYAKALEFMPKMVDARVARAGLLLDLGRMEDLGKALEGLKATNPEDPRGAYLNYVYLSRKGNAHGARAALLETAKLIDSLPPEMVKRRDQFLMLGALAHYALKAHAKAQSYLEGYLHIHPDHAGARKLLGTIYLDEGKAEIAIPILERAYKQAPQDAKVLSLLAAAYLARNQPAKAANLLEQAGKGVQQLPELSAALGFSLLGIGQEDQGLQHISRAFRQTPGDLGLGTSLAMLHLQRGQAKEAVGIAEALVKSAGRNAAVHNLLGVTKAAAGDRRGAKSAYEKAIALDASLDAPLLNLAKLERMEGQFDAARKHYGALLKRKPEHPQALLELAKTEEAAGRPAEAISRLEKLLAKNSGDHQAALALAELHLRQNQAGKALDLAKTLSAQAPENAAVLSLLGRAHAALGEVDRAKGAFNSMGRIAGFDIEQLAQVARLQLKLGDLDGANLSLNKALSTAPNALPVNLLMAELELRRNDPDKAQARVRQIVAAHPRDAEGRRLSGDIALARGQMGEATQHYQASLELADTADNALRLYQALTRAGETGRANAMLDAWNRKHPSVATTQLALADGWLRAGQNARAKTAYEAYLKYHGDHPAALNNLANTLLRQGDLAGALRQAEKAYRLAPENHMINDTLGWLLLQKGEIDRALRHLRDARLRAPKSGEVRFHLAAALNRSGRRDEARTELEQALRDGNDFEGREQAEQLLKELGRR